MSYETLVSGRPTGPDVEEILKVYKPEEMKPGMEIEHDTISEIIQTHKKTGRFKVVYDAWKKKLFRDYNIVLESRDGLVFHVLTDKERVDYSSRRLVSGMKTTKKAGNIALTTDDAQLDDNEKRRRTHLITVAGSLSTMFHKEKKKIKYNIGTINVRP